MTKVQELTARVKALSPADRLRIAAGLIEQGRPELARPLIDQISDELNAEDLALHGNGYVTGESWQPALKRTPDPRD